MFPFKSSLESSSRSSPGSCWVSSTCFFSKVPSNLLLALRPRSCWDIVHDSFSSPPWIDLDSYFLFVNRFDFSIFVFVNRFVCFICSIRERISGRQKFESHIFWSFRRIIFSIRIILRINVVCSNHHSNHFVHVQSVFGSYDFTFESFSENRSNHFELCLGLLVLWLSIIGILHYCFHSYWEGANDWSCFDEKTRWLVARWWEDILFLFWWEESCSCVDGKTSAFLFWWGDILLLFWWECWCCFEEKKTLCSHFDGKTACSFVDWEDSVSLFWWEDVLLLFWWERWCCFEEKTLCSYFVGRQLVVLLGKTVCPCLMGRHSDVVLMGTFVLFVPMGFPIFHDNPQPFSRWCWRNWLGS